MGRIHTTHGVIDTPSFVAVGTNGTLKALPNDLVDAIGLQLMFCNTYHLLLQPGPEVVKKSGGLHSFMSRKNPLITDSGGFQVFSLMYGSVREELKSQGKKKSEGSVLKITEEGVLFRSYRDGSRVWLTPENSVETQKALGADIIIPLDELLPYHTERKDVINSLERTHRWERRSLEAHLRDPQHQAMYSVVHGGIDKELRLRSVNYLRELPFDGVAIGGSVGKNRAELVELISFLAPHLPEEKPNHLLGIGDLPSLEALVPLGIDTFDSSYPTRAARHGLLLGRGGGVKIDQRVYATDFRPIEEGCRCHTCATYNRAYVHHLFKAKELVGLILATVHNLTYMVDLMARYREGIMEGRI